MSDWTYRRTRRALLTIATLTIAISAALLTVLSPTHVARTLHLALQDTASSAHIAAALADTFARSGLEPATASATAADVVHDSLVHEALDRAASGDPSQVPHAIRNAATASAPGATEALAASAGAVLQSADVSSRVSAAGAGRVIDVAGPRALGEVGGVSGWVLENAWVLVLAGAGISLAGLVALGGGSAGRRVATVMAVGRWAVVCGGLPLVALLLVATVVPDLDVPAVGSAVAVVAPALFGPAVPLWVGVLTVGCVGLVTGPFLARASLMRGLGSGDERAAREG